MKPFAQWDRRIHERVAFFLPFRDVLTLRLVCRATLTGATDELLAEMERIVGRFVPRPADLLTRMGKREGVVGGSCAAKFFLRELDFVPFNLDIYVRQDAFQPALYYLTKVQEGTEVTFTSWDTTEGAGLRDRGIDTIAHVTTSKGQVNLVQSAHLDPLVPIVRAWCSLLVNFFNPVIFGCAYPYLLFNHVGIVGARATQETDLVSTWKGRGVDLRLSTSQWSELEKPKRCGDNVWSCAMSLRCFDDDASLYSRVEPLKGTKMRSILYWRLDTRVCEGGCDWRVRTMFPKPAIFPASIFFTHLPDRLRR
ncbi:hypothetical protein C8Q76DRAFT_800566 [Earliella scabrosa]|nr:hypothetical protein C8Q76DRAFT_800819 [Earliella scabrosa]KAI0707218.1 hypothetical protein C8Q76DRAFT_800566 [Earliella scabrosa]